MRPQANASVPASGPGFFAMILAAGAVVTVLRFWKGLGAVTNLSDRFPWGLWVGFDVLCGVGLAAGGFTITTAVYVFNLKRFRPIVRPTILTAFLGYILVAVGLMYDLGKPWNIWHPMVMWNPRSRDVRGVLVRDALPHGARPRVLGHGVREARLAARGRRSSTPRRCPLVIAGAVISTLHQSSLGTFYLITPGKLHALWYTPLLPLMFYLSAIAGGLAMMIVESRLTSRALGRGLEMPLLQSIGQGAHGRARLLRRGALRRHGAPRRPRRDRLRQPRGRLLPARDGDRGYPPHGRCWRCRPCAATPGGSTGPPSWWSPASW